MDGSGEQPRGGGPTSSEQIMKTGALLLQGFIQDRAGRMGGETPELALEQVPQDASTKKLSECLKRIGDELDSNMELQRMIAAVDTDSPREVFFRVAADMFSDGNFNWGRVVALFYFASKLVLKVGGCRAVSPGKCHSDLRGPRGCEVNPCGSPLTQGNGESYGLVVCSFIYSCGIYWAYYVPDLYSTPEMQHQTAGWSPALLELTLSNGC
ncbi:apoptosis regulator BAX isoform X1 [Neomonachus schauinslandi]|uniref:Apoptosis regulator BAX isoform X1 n=1 Tax=Neomonachus schauinslandi TaxID=29088 RepID=A0A8M1MZF4_NEOSC|nr:apoptosis regulator BAX isoform X1 [Neomonachus schauinslandi]